MKTIHENNDTVLSGAISGMIRESIGGVLGDISVPKALKRLRTAKTATGVFTPNLEICHFIRFDDDPEEIRFSISHLCHNGWDTTDCKYLKLNIVHVND